MSDRCNAVTARRHPTPLQRGERHSGQERSFDLVFLDSSYLMRESLANSLALVGPQLHLSCFASFAEWEASGVKNCDVSVILVYSRWLEPRADDIFFQIEQIKALGYLIHVVVICDKDKPDNVLELIDKGARGYIPTNAGLKLSVKIIELVAAGGLYIPHDLLSLSGRSTEQTLQASKQEINISSDLTSRQRAVVEALRHGKANKTIAYELNMRESTVKAHVHNVMRKFNARNRTEVAYLANANCGI